MSKVEYLFLYLKAIFIFFSELFEGFVYYVSYFMIFFFIFKNSLFIIEISLLTIM